MAIPVACLAAASQLAFAGTSVASSYTVTSAHHSVGTIKPSTKLNTLDCNQTGLKRLCTDPHGPLYDGHLARFRDPKTGEYVGHDEPSVKFISAATGSGNTMSYAMQLPRDPTKTPTSTGSVTTYAELSVAPWFGLPICDPLSYPQNTCTPLSDTNTGTGLSTDAGSAFMELQFYPPGIQPLQDGVSCSKTQWCSALNIDSLECQLGIVNCNPGCVEPVNFALMQTNGVPAGPPAPQDPSESTFAGNASTLKMNPGDVLKVSITDVANTAISPNPDNGGLKATVADVTTGQTGYIVASAANGFADTSIADCNGHPFSFHAEYNTASQQNQVPWAALEGGVLMEQEIGHGEACSSVSHKLGFSASYTGGSSYSDPSIYQVCNGGQEGSGKTGEGPCNPSTAVCQHATTQGTKGPAKCSTNLFNSGALCEFADGFCLPKGNRTVSVSGVAAKFNSPVAFCLQNAFQNGDLDYDGTSYHADWPSGSSNFPTSIRYVGPFTAGGGTYPSIQFETDAAGSENLCNLSTGANCTAPPISAKFYPFWTLTSKQPIAGQTANCTWNFGNVISGITTNNFGKDVQYGTPDVARYAGTLTSAVLPNPQFTGNCHT
ncbi:MAG TPA: hypothetical protein VIX86_17505 [Streptosporangiaceae bacterium]